MKVRVLASTLIAGFAVNVAAENSSDFPKEALPKRVQLIAHIDGCPEKFSENGDAFAVAVGLILRDMRGASKETASRYLEAITEEAERLIKENKIDCATAQAVADNARSEARESPRHGAAPGAAP